MPVSFSLTRKLEHVTIAMPVSFSLTRTLEHVTIAMPVSFSLTRTLEHVIIAMPVSDIQFLTSTITKWHGTLLKVNDFRIVILSRLGMG